MICLYSTIATSAHSTRNTSIRTRKIRGEESFVGSISCTEREAVCIAGAIRPREAAFSAPTVWHSASGRKVRLSVDPGEQRELPREARLGCLFTKLRRLRQLAVLTFRRRWGASEASEPAIRR